MAGAIVSHLVAFAFGAIGATVAICVYLRRNARLVDLVLTGIEPPK